MRTRKCELCLSKTKLLENGYVQCVSCGVLYKPTIVGGHKNGKRNVHYSKTM